MPPQILSDINLLSQAWEKRQSLHDSSSTNVYRVFSSEEGISGLSIDRYDHLVLFQIKTDGLESDEKSRMQQWASWYLDKKEIKSVYFKPFVKNRNESEKIFVHLAGEPSPEIIQVRENGITFLVEPYSDWSTGLFLDQKENRLFTGSLSTDKKVLNLFSYTCSFSVYAAYFNSVQVTSVDLSRRFLERGKENFRANKLNPENHLFFCEDVFSFLKRANKKKNQYDLIILDPPSFSRNKEGKVFTIEKDLEALIRLCDGVLSEGGVLFCSSNYEGWDKKTFENIVNRAVGKGYRIMKTPALEGEKLLVSCQRRVFASAAKQSH